MIRDEARVFSFVVQEQEAGPVADLELPEDSRIICFYRDDRFAMADADSTLKEGDEAVVLTHSRNLRKLQERWAPPEQKSPGGGNAQASGAGKAKPLR